MLSFVLLLIFIMDSSVILISRRDHALKFISTNYLVAVLIHLLFSVV